MIEPKKFYRKLDSQNVRDFSTPRLENVIVKKSKFKRRRNNEFYFLVSK